MNQNAYSIKSSESSTGEKYIYRYYKNRYQVSMPINGRTRSFGAYEILDEAMLVRNIIIERLGITPDTNNVATDEEIAAVRQELEVMARNRVNMTPVDTENTVPVDDTEDFEAEVYYGSSTATETNVEASGMEYANDEFAPIVRNGDGSYTGYIQVLGKRTSIGSFGSFSEASNAIMSVRY